MQPEVALTAYLVDCLKFGPNRGLLLIRLRWHEMEGELRKPGETGLWTGLLRAVYTLLLPPSYVPEEGGENITLEMLRGCFFVCGV